ncbi:MAG: class I SAM-dependent methyltransferase [Oscillospiraceae bacterium]|nr:class I SAM-dependent methyltransferase [Oscillospiraceae bacterium]
MDYIKSNKAAWEEAFDHRRTGWSNHNDLHLKKEKFAFFDSDLKKILESIDFKGKTVAQFCCNDGRELLSLMDGGATHGVGFDIAENMIEYAIETAEKADITNCSFHACDILKIPENYYNQFDFIFFTIGGIIWFEDLSLLFEKVSKCLKDGGMLLINDFHPIVNMLALPGEPEYQPDNLNRVAHSYFNRTPWVSNSGMEYMSTLKESKTFTSYRHKMSDIINALIKNGFSIANFEEYDYDIMLETKVYEGIGFPLSYTLIAEKRSY